MINCKNFKFKLNNIINKKLIIYILYIINYFCTFSIQSKILIVILKHFFIAIGDWGLGIGDWGLGIRPNPQSPIPNTQ